MQPPPLTPADHALIDLIIEHRFALSRIAGNHPNLHPAAASLLTLTTWLKLPHIDAAITTLLADLRAAEVIRTEFLQRHAIDGLEEAMHKASRNLQLLEESRQHNAQHTRAVEELRLAAQSLHRATKPGSSSGSPHTPCGGSSSHSSSPAGRTKIAGGEGRAATKPPENSLPTSPRFHNAPTCDNLPHLTDQCDSASPSSLNSEISNLQSPASHSEGVQVRSRGSSRSDTPRQITQNTSVRFHDAPTCDNTLPLTDRCGSASSGSTRIPCGDSSSLKSEISNLQSPVSHSATTPLCHEVHPPGRATSSPPSTPSHLNTLPSHRARDHPQ